ncbi:MULTISPECIES: alpha/beta fold hydrolase [unclassified Corynebacterium]|uniref:alpha/beta fold hydrolase n=1 Tax=unclassified Corynebacterium TaxID=2624378 RepID=UPI0034CE7405
MLASRRLTRPILAFLLTSSLVATNVSAHAAPTAELPESALGHDALSDPVADQSPDTSEQVREAADEMNHNSPSLHSRGADKSTGDAYSSFYHDPVDLDGSSPGQLFRNSSVRNPLNTLGITNIGPYKAERILYSSTNRKGEPIPVSGIVIEPKKDWMGDGPRPVVAYAPGTQGVADHCSPSRKIAEGVGDYEQLFFESLLKEGYAVVLTDYEGLGTPGLHTYMDRLSQAHAVLDSVRAAQQLDGWDLGPENPVFLNGYSQGGGATASAAEQYDSYAPELNVKLATVGAAPADLTLLPPALDGTTYFLFELFALLGLSQSYGIDFNDQLSPRGQKVLRNATNTCTLGLGLYSGQTISGLTADGADVHELIDTAPYNQILAEQHIGHRAPTVPVIITHSRGDDVIPFDTAEQLAAEWADRGAQVTFLPNDAGSHVAGTIPHIDATLDAIKAVLNS